MSEEIYLRVDRLEEMLALRQWGPGELSYHSGVGYDTIYKIRTHDRPRTSAEIVAKLAKALRCTMEFLMNAATDPLGLGVELPEYGAEMLDVLSALPPARGADLLEIGRRMAHAQHEADARALNVMLAALRRNADDEAREVLAEALRLSDAGDVSGALGLIEGFFVRREAEEEREEPAYDS